MRRVLPVDWLVCRKVMNETGQEVPSSGIYRVVHAEHRLPTEVVLIAGNKFPRCGKCANAVEFELIKPAPHFGATNVVVHQISARESERRAA
jgi:hypothetical protein